MDKPLLSIIIPAKNEGANIARCLRSVIKATAEIKAVEILVVDGASTDRTIELTRKFPVNIIQLKPNWLHTSAAGRYLGTLHTKGKYLFIIDADMELVPSFLEQALRFMQADDSIAGVAGLAKEIYLQAGQKSGCAENIYKRNLREIKPTDYLGGAALFRRTALVEVGHFNPFLYSQEELELSQRLTTNGWRLFSLPFAMIIHYTEPAKAIYTFKKQIAAKRFTGIGQLMRLSLSSGRFWSNLWRFKKFTFFLILIFALLVVSIIAVANRNAPALAWVATGISGLYLHLAVKKKSLKQAGVSAIKWVVIIFTVLIGLLKKVKPAQDYPRAVKIIKTYNKMNIAFVCTAEFEPFLYDCLGRQLEPEGVNVFFTAFFLDTRNALKKIKRRCFPESSKVNKKKGPTAKASLFNKQELEEIIRYDYLRLKQNGARISKQRLINKAIYYERFFRYFYSQHKIEAIIVWNYFPLMVNVATKVARQMQLKQIFFENGPLRNTLMIDAQGVNYQSSLADKKREFYENVKIDPEKWQAFVKEYKGTAVTPAEKNQGIMNPLEKSYHAFLMRNYFYRLRHPDLTDDQICQSVYKKLYSHCLIKEQVIDLPEKFIFLPFQYPADTQILINSPNIKNMAEFLNLCYLAIKKQLPAEYKIVVKEHPDDLGRTNYRKLRKQYPDVIWLKKYNIRELIQKAQLVITINSSVGVEALFFHKPVITLGKSFYNIDGLVGYAENLNTLIAATKTALANPVNKQLIDKFIYYLRFEYLVDGSPYYCDLKSLHQASQRVKKLLGEL